MSEIIGLIGFDAEDPASSERWAFSNSNTHQAVHQALEAQNLGNLTQFQLWPVRWENPRDFLLRHQSDHNDINQVLGVAGTDLTGIDFKDQAQLDQWNQAHYDEHLTWVSLLGI